MHADPCSTSAHSSHSHAQKASPHSAHPLYCQIRLSRWHILIVALSESTFLSTAHSFPLFHPPTPTCSSQPSPGAWQSETPCTPIIPSPVNILELVPHVSQCCLQPTAHHANLQEPVGHLLVLCLTAQKYHAAKYTQDCPARVQEARFACSTWRVQEAQARDQEHEPKYPRRQLASHRFNKP